MGHRNFSAGIKYFKLKIESQVPFSPAFPVSHKAKLNFFAVSTSYTVESGFIRATYFLSKIRNCLDAVERDDLSS